MPLLFTHELDGRTGFIFNNKAKPILFSRGVTTNYADRFIEASGGRAEVLTRR